MNSGNIELLHSFFVDMDVGIQLNEQEVVLARMFKNSMTSVMALLALGIFICHVASFAQKNTETAKLYAEIAGDYEFMVEGQTTVLIFYVKDGVLMGKSDDDDEEVPLEPVEGKELGFEATNNQGQFYEITFSRDESGKITKCLIMTMGFEVEGTKIKK